MKRLTRSILVFAIIFSILLSVPAAAASAVEPRASKYFTSYSAKIVSKGGGNYALDFDVTGTKTLAKIGVTKIVLYKNGAAIDTIRYTDSDGSGLMAYSTYIHAHTLNLKGTSGSKYYAVLTFYGADSSGNDTKTYITTTVTI